MASHNLQALLFDVDGTLADTERDGHRVAFTASPHAPTSELWVMENIWPLSE